MTLEYKARACRIVVDNEIADRIRRMYGVSLDVGKDVMTDFFRGEVVDSSGKIIGENLDWPEAVRLAMEKSRRR